MKGEGRADVKGSNVQQAVKDETGERLQEVELMYECDSRMVSINQMLQYELDQPTQGAFFLINVECNLYSIS